MNYVQPRLVMTWQIIIWCQCSHSVANRRLCLFVFFSREYTDCVTPAIKRWWELNGSASIILNVLVCVDSWAVAKFSDATKCSKESKSRKKNTKPRLLVSTPRRPVRQRGPYRSRLVRRRKHLEFQFLFVCFITKSFLTYSFFSPTPALSTISRPLSSSMCSITPETANVGRGYNPMRGPGIGCWFSDRSNCSHWSLTLTFTLTSENLSL